MNKKFIVISTIIAGVCLFLVGCHPKTITWSPDGQWAAFCNDYGLYFTDGQGEISSRMAEKAYRAEWFSDGKRLAIEQFVTLTSWQQVQNTVSEDYRDKFIQCAEGLLAVKNKRDWDEKTNMLEHMNFLDEDELDAVQLYIRDMASGGFPKDVIASWGDSIEFDYHFLRIGTWDGATFTMGEPLWGSPERIWDMRISAKGHVVAFTSAFPGDFDEGTSSSLWAADVETKEVVLLDKNSSLYPDWDAAGTRLFYVRSIGKESSDNPLGTLLSRQICGQDGNLLSDLPEPQSLAGLVAGEFTKVRCLPDGRIVFSSMEVTLPVIGKDIPEQKQLFVLDLQRQSTITRLIPRSEQSKTEGYSLDHFEISPDQKQISIPDDEGRVMVLTIATGEFVVLQAQKVGDIRTVPVWRYPDELCYIDELKGGLLGDKTRKEIMLRKVTPDGEWSDPRAISKDWSKEVRQVVLD